MKRLLLLAMLMIGCKPSPKVEAPVAVLEVEKPELVFKEKEVRAPGPIIYYHVDPVTDFQEANLTKGGAAYKFGGITAAFQNLPDSVRLDCSNGGTTIFTCNSDGGYLLIACEKMVFKLSCEMF